MSRSVATEQSDFESKMLLVKQKKKQAEHDKRLLVNRIALLKKEERKAYKKIEKTKERAQEVLTVRIEHERHHSERVARHARNERRRKLEAEANKASEAEARRNRQLAMQHVQQLKFAKVREARSEAAHARDRVRRVSPSLPDGGGFRSRKPVEEVLTWIDAEVSALGEETVSLQEAHGRVLAWG